MDDTINGGNLNSFVRVLKFQKEMGHLISVEMIIITLNNRHESVNVTKKERHDKIVNKSHVFRPTIWSHSFKNSDYLNYFIDT
jgi:rubrerythrin